MSDDCTCTPNDVCYPCYARRRYGQDADRKVEGLPVGTPSSCSPPMTSERAEECSITAHCFVSDRHTGQEGCVFHAAQSVPVELKATRLAVFRLMSDQEITDGWLPKGAVLVGHLDDLFEEVDEL